MLTVTKLEPQKKNPQRLNVYLNGDFAFGISRAIAPWLEEGNELSQQKITALKSALISKNTRFRKYSSILSWKSCGKDLSLMTGNLPNNGLKTETRSIPVVKELSHQNCTEKESQIKSSKKLFRISMKRSLHLNSPGKKWSNLRPWINPRFRKRCMAIYPGGVLITAYVKK